MATIKNPSDLLGSVRNRITRTKPPTAAQRVLDELGKAAGEVRGRLPGGTNARSEAAKKSALTRKRNEAKRSASAKKGAATRAKAKRR